LEYFRQEFYWEILWKQHIQIRLKMNQCLSRAYITHLIYRDNERKKSEILHQTVTVGLDLRYATKLSVWWNLVWFVNELVKMCEIVSISISIWFYAGSYCGGFYLEIKIDTAITSLAWVQPSIIYPVSKWLLFNVKWTICQLFHGGHMWHSMKWWCCSFCTRPTRVIGSLLC
jgi:hypothetical protein